MKIILKMKLILKINENDFEMKMNMMKLKNDFEMKNEMILK